MSRRHERPASFGPAFTLTTTTLEGGQMFSRITHRLFGNPKRKAVSIVSGLALAAATAALAAWLLSGVGPGAGQIGSMQPLTVSAGTPASGDVCLPGGKCGATFSITNPNTADVTMTGIAMKSGSFTTSQAMCPASNLTLDPAVTSATLNVSLPAGKTTTVTVPNAVDLASSAPSVCQGVTFTTPSMTVNAQAGS